MLTFENVFFSLEVAISTMVAQMIEKSSQLFNDEIDMEILNRFSHRGSTTGDASVNKRNEESTPVTKEVPLIIRSRKLDQSKRKNLDRSELKGNRAMTLTDNRGEQQ